MEDLVHPYLSPSFLGFTSDPALKCSLDGKFLPKQSPPSLTPAAGGAVQPGSNISKLIMQTGLRASPNVQSTLPSQHHLQVSVPLARVLSRGLRRHLGMHLSPTTSALNNEVVTRGTTSKIVGLPNKRHFSLVKLSIKATLLC